ncbi:hypothetical protein [Ruegeria lacuscaerulensis]|uniref:COG3904 family protein n=1 Tax=Ruegeria lacuscaerulensis TaxID=55218 RepID=UPI001480A47B|nr:hypothetical protein [Ruegeria lacuscaerulensis]
MTNRFYLSTAVLLFTWSPFTSAHAAEVTKTPNDEMRCYISVEGPIEAGDADKIRDAMASFSTDHPEEANLFYPNSMNSWKKVCFDSTGGSFSEGVKIAQYLLGKRIGSAVPKDAQCLSACAVAFMGGTNDTKGDAGLLPFRQLHPLGNLGFHAPFIEVPEREYSAQTVQQAFEGALANIGFLLERGDQMNIQRSLVLRMLNTPSDDMLYVNTVGEASRWGIAIAPVAPRDELDAVSTINACYNHEFFLQDTLLPIFANTEDVAIEKEGSRMTGKLPFGFRGERAMPCDIIQPADSEYNRYGPLTHRAIHSITDNEGVYPYQMYDPQTPITALYNPDGKPPARIAKIEKTTDAEAVCLVFADGRFSDREPCRWEIVKTRHADLTVDNVWRFHWPSGSQTVVEKGKAGTRQADILNGSSAQKIDSWNLPDGTSTAINDAAQILTTPEERWLNEDCWLNNATGSIFCFGSFSVAGYQTMEEITE